jgi:hypothetical protein
LIEILRFGSAELLGVAIYSNTEAPKRKILTEFINVELCVLYSIVRWPKFGYPRCEIHRPDRDRRKEFVNPGNLREVTLTIKLDLKSGRVADLCQENI